MAYSSIQGLAKNFWSSERTIYSYLKKFGEKVRTKRENWTLQVHFNDFFWITSNRLKKFYNASQWTHENITPKGFWSNEVKSEEVQRNFTTKQDTLQNFWRTSQAVDQNPYLETIQAIEVKYEKLQSRIDAIKSENEQLNQAKQNFENQASKYAIMYKEEQAEKKIREGKFLGLQENHMTFRIKMERIIMGLIVVLSIFLMAFAVLYFIGAVSVKIPQE